MRRSDAVQISSAQLKQLHQMYVDIEEHQLLFSLVLFLGVFDEEGVAPPCQEKTSSNPPAATISYVCRLLLFEFSLPTNSHPLAQNFHHHVAHSLEAHFHYAGYTLYRVEHATVITPRPTYTFAVSIPDEAYLCQYRQRSRFISSWLLKRA